MGDYSQWLSNLSITDQNGSRLSYSSASSVVQAQIVNATAITAYFGQPAGSSLSIQVNGNGGTNDVPAYTLTIPGSAPVSSPYLANRAGGIVSQEKSRAANILGCGLLNCTPGAASAAGGVLSSALPSNFQAASALATQAQAAAAFPTVISSSAPPGVPAGTASPVVVPVSAGIPRWVWLLGGAAILFVVFQGGNE